MSRRAAAARVSHASQQLQQQSHIPAAAASSSPVTPTAAAAVSTGSVARATISAAMLRAGDKKKKAKKRQESSGPPLRLLFFAHWDMSNVSPDLPLLDSKRLRMLRLDARDPSHATVTGAFDVLRPKDPANPGKRMKKSSKEQHQTPFLRGFSDGTTTGQVWFACPDLVSAFNVSNSGYDWEHL